MIKLEKYQSNYKHGNIIKRLLWMIVSVIFFENKLPIPSKIKSIILNLFGASISKSVVIKPNVKIKYPWNLIVGDYSWIGEYVWIDNLAKVEIGSNCCISQGAYLLTGNHNYKKITFDLIISDIEIKDDVWIGAQSIVCPGVIVNKLAILSVGSVANKDLLENGIYQGNPAVLKKERVIIK
ncbi:WcaF family extracellular polysaccharide biosynthesis acetyltransferase [Photobacterium phosphoreum]|uniref:WcaF family extracellular polysaccharide biosynthesis acetyltransferase n=1 Tax=Photobacterium phosphoreum TaxID=659 RepID=UPI0024314A46|nr:WcaF family extracellular polysaccharide biosynthesis acetyltransferase [Photobacterium phosphoreum]